jgi:hypothetical protein
MINVMRQPKLNTESFLFCSCAVLLFCCALHAQENCNVEVKLLLSPTETLPTIAAFNAKKEAGRRLYFFDTDALDLLSQGAIVRLRRGARSDLTVKLRPANGKKSIAISEGSEGFKCEVDLTGEGSIASYSILRRFAPERSFETGNDISRLLSPAQKKLLEEAQVSVDWSRVKRIVEITSTSWQAQTQPLLGKLTLELWEWPGGKALEISMKVSPDAGSSTYTELQQLVKSKQLSISPVQRAKTSIALEAIRHTTVH